MPPYGAQVDYSWVSLLGTFDHIGDEIIFRGYDYTPLPLGPPPPKEVESSSETIDVRPRKMDETGAFAGTGSSFAEAARAAEPSQPLAPPPQPRGGVGQYLSNQRLPEGSVSVDITFDSVDPNSTAEIMVDFDPMSNDMMNAGIGPGSFLSIRQWTTPPAATDKASSGPTEQKPTQRWNYLRQIGDLSNLRASKTYHVELAVQGSLLTLLLDGVETISTFLQSALGGRQVGLFCQNRKDIHFKNFGVRAKRPLAFVVMQLHPPEYEDLFHKVIVPVCAKLGLEAFRASETFEPGLIIHDIQQKIRQSRVVIAEISPVNANVYYEVGFADAISKPLILIADAAKVEALPFDVKGFRTIFYENSIGGKERVEETLTHYLNNIMGRRM